MDWIFSTVSKSVHWFSWAQPHPPGSTRIHQDPDQNPRRPSNDASEHPMDFISFIRAWVQHPQLGVLEIITWWFFQPSWWSHFFFIVSIYLKSLLTKSSDTNVCWFFWSNPWIPRIPSPERVRAWHEPSLSSMMWPRNGNDAPGIRPQALDFSRLCSDMFMVFVYDDNDDLWMGIGYTLFADKTICFPSPGYCNLKGPQLILDIYASSVRGMPITDFAKTKPAWAY